jgi:GYF domain 2
MQAEVFFIYHNGEQRGPYTAPQVNHLHRCGFIDDDTLYWREGLDQWQPVGQIVLRRKRRRRLLFWSILLGALVLIAPLVMLFGPVTADAWRELTSGDFAEESAWWRARGLVRDQMPKGTHVRFDPFSSAQVTLHGRDGATVILGGTLTPSSGPAEHGAWRVLLRYDADHGTWATAPKSDASKARN